MYALFNIIVSFIITGTVFFLCLFLLILNKYKKEIWKTIVFKEEGNNGKQNWF